MKKKLLTLCSILSLSLVLGACSLSDKIPLLGNGKDSTSVETSDSILGEESSSINHTDGTTEGNPDDDTNDETDDTDDTDDTKTYLYNSFTPSEKETQILLFGETIPFVPNDEYYVETFSNEDGTGIYFYTYGNTQAEFERYKEKFSEYTFVEEYEYEGIPCFVYEKNGYCVDIAYFLDESGEYCIDVCAYLFSEDEGDDTDDDLELLKMAYALQPGTSLPGQYYLTGVVTEIEKTDDGDICLTFVVGDYKDYPMYCYWLQDADFLWPGDTITVYGTIKNHYDLIEFDHPELISYVFGDESLPGEDDDSGDLGGGGSGGYDPDVDILTNDGKGLPTGTNGVYDVDFTKATYVKNVHDQGYYLDGCPTTGNVKVLVIPVEFSDVTAASQGYKLETIDTAFNGEAGSTDYLSVSDYYQTSSGGQLNLTFDVMDSWFRPSKNSAYYLNATMDYDGEEMECGDQIIIDEFLQKYENSMDFSKYDSDNNGYIDAIVLINTLKIDYDVTMQWAYRFWNLYSDNDGYYYEYDGVSAYDYLWASYQFLFESADGEFNDKNAINTYTYIHEFGHVLGAEDYYDTSYEDDYSPLGGYDMMDSESGDHNPYTKFNYGWITSSRLVTTSTSVTLTLNDFTKTGDTVIIANNWDDTLGAYQEYFVLIYYTNEGTNANGFGYFDEEGIVVYHVNASLYKETLDGETYYDVYNNNTNPEDPNGYGTENNLIELVSNAGGGYVFGGNDSLASNTYLDNGDKISYVFTVNALNDGQATVTFKKNN